MNRWYSFPHKREYFHEKKKKKENKYSIPIKLSTYHLNPSNWNRLKSCFDPTLTSIRFIIYPTESVQKVQFQPQFPPHRGRITGVTLERPSHHNQRV